MTFIVTVFGYIAAKSSDEPAGDTFALLLILLILAVAPFVAYPMVIENRILSIAVGLVMLGWTVVLYISALTDSSSTGALSIGGSVLINLVIFGAAALVDAIIRSLKSPPVR